MFVLCPHCQFLVAVDPASGQPPARCPRCDGAIAAQSVAGAATNDGGDADANAHADGASVPDAQAEAMDAAAPGQPEPAVASGGAAADEVAEADAAISEGADDAGSPASTGVDGGTDDVAEDAAPTQPPRIARAPATAHRWRKPLAIGGLALLLVLQMLLADRAQLAAGAQWRPTLSALCGALRCTLPTWHEPAAFTLVDRDVRPDARTPGVLHVSARFRNDARWPQAWPRVLLTLSDIDGRVAGARGFAPREYAASAVTQKPIASGQVVAIAMDVVEPAPDIVAFTFDFR